MTGSRQPLTIRSGPRADGDSHFRKPRADRSGSRVPEPVGFRWGWVELLSQDIIRQNGYRHVKIRCTGCGTEKTISYDNIRAGKTRGCQPCSQPQRVPSKLRKRLSDAKTRCTNPKHPNWPHYGGRGIKFSFSSVLAAGLWVMENLGVPEAGQEIDRIDNNGHYAEGNLRLAPRVLNASNTRDTRCVLAFHKFRLAHPEVRYADTTLRRLLRSGMSFAEILERWQRPSCKPKGVYGTFSTADPVLVSRLTEGW